MTWDKSHNFVPANRPAPLHRSRIPAVNVSCWKKGSRLRSSMWSCLKVFVFTFSDLAWQSILSKNNSSWAMQMCEWDNLVFHNCDMESVSHYSCCLLGLPDKRSLHRRCERYTTLWNLCLCHCWLLIGWFDRCLSSKASSRRLLWTFGIDHNRMRHSCIDHIVSA